MKTIPFPRVPWRVRRFFNALRVNHIRWPMTALRFLAKRPELDIIFSGQFFGGVGGTEKKLMCLVESMPNARFHIYTGRATTNGFVPKTYNWYVNLPVSRRRSFDAAIVFCGGGIPDNLLEGVPSTVRLVDTNATPIHGIEDKFDYILVQTHDMDRFTKRTDKFLTAFPDPRPGFPKTTKPVEGLPDRYFLTVFNPFSQAQKRQDWLYSLAPNAALPIVWCFNDSTGWDFSDERGSDKIIIMKNLPQEQLYYVYQHATAYVSFSLWESFGWTLAEAFFNNIPIVSSDTGIISYIKSQRGIYCYSTMEELEKFLHKDQFETSNFDKSVLLDRDFAKIIPEVVKTKKSTLLGDPG